MLLTWIAEIADEPLLLEPDDRAVEQRTNTWCLSAEHEDRARWSVSEAAAAFEPTATAIQARIHDSGHLGPATFSVWYDSQAGQLRCSTASADADELSFDGLHLSVHGLRHIIEVFLGDATPGVVAWSDLEDAAGSAAPEAEPSPFPVWVRSIGGAAA